MITNKIENIDDIDSKFKFFNDRHENIYKFVMLYNDYIYSSHSYTNSLPMTMIEVHTLVYINDNPGSQPSDLVKYWNKTKGAISQILKKLEIQGLISKEKKEANKRNVHLYVTEQGHKVSQAHKLFDIEDINKTMSKLLISCSTNEIDTFFKVINKYNEIILSDFEINKTLKN